MSLPYIRNLKTRLCFSSLSVRSYNQSFNNSVVLGLLAICAQAHHYNIYIYIYYLDKRVDVVHYVSLPFDPHIFVFVW